MCCTSRQSAARQRSRPEDAVRAARHGLQTISIGTVTALVAGLAAWTLKPSSTQNPSPIARLSISLPPGDDDWADLPSLSLSSDGRMLAYTAGRANAADSCSSAPSTAWTLRC